MSLDISNFLIKAAAIGFPVRMIRFVWNNSTTKIGGHNYYRPFWNRLYLTEGTVGGLQKASLGIPWGDLGRAGPGRRYAKIPMILSERYDVQSLYHEATHAYLEVKSDDVEKLLKQAGEYYNGTTVETSDGKRRSSKDGWRLANEAAGQYVGHRASVMWETLDILHYIREYYVAKEPKDPLNARVKVEEVRLDYIREMNKRMIFGYETHDGRDYSVKDREFPEFLRDWCDRVILEGKIPNSFHDAPSLMTLYFQVYKEIGLEPIRSTGRHHSSDPRRGVGRRR